MVRPPRSLPRNVQLFRPIAMPRNDRSVWLLSIAPGDWISIQSNLRDGLYNFTNGERVKVASVNEQGGIVLEDKRTIPHNFRQFTHGYAITAHRAQGKTVDEVIISG